MTSEQIKQRVAVLENDRLRGIAQVNALEGAIQDCRYWLEQLTQPPVEQPLAQDMTIVEGGKQGEAK